MSEREHEQTETGGGTATSNAVNALAAAAATGAATYAVRKALAARDTHDASDEHEDDDAEERTPNGSDRSGGKSSLRQLVDPGILASASHLLLPVVEHLEEVAQAEEHRPEDAPQDPPGGGRDGAEQRAAPGHVVEREIHTHLRRGRRADPGRGNPTPPLQIGSRAASASPDPPVPRVVRECLKGGALRCRRNPGPRVPRPPDHRPRDRR